MITSSSIEAQAQSHDNNNIEALTTSTADGENLNELTPSQANSDTEDSEIDESETEVSESGDIQKNESALQKSQRMRFKNLTPLRKKTLELLRENPDLDGTTADRLARESLGLPMNQSYTISSKAKVVEGMVKNKNQFIPARGNLGTSSRNDLNKDSIIERLQGLSFADRKEALLTALTAAAQKSRRR